MINLITGLPGNGKTAYVVWLLWKLGKAENRPVFYSGIQLTEQGKSELGWIEIDGEKWHEAPPGALIIIDEAQRVFRPRLHGRDVPQHVAELETHRHHGVDLFLITQHPMLIDNEVRRLAGNHRHVVRKFGMQAATIHEWTEVRQDCEKGNRRQDSAKTSWVYDKRVYLLYKSAEVHTHKVRIPKHFWIAAGCVGALGLVGFGFAKYTESKIAKATPAVQPVAGGVQLAGSSTQSQPAQQFDLLADAKRFIAMQTPRVEGQLYTAPKYDDLTRPDTVPMPAACVYSLKRCQCYTQQGTKIPTDYNTCLDLAHNGYFQEFDHHGNTKTREASRVLNDQERLPISGASTKDVMPHNSASSVAALASVVPSGVRHADESNGYR